MQRYEQQQRNAIAAVTALNGKSNFSTKQHFQYLVSEECSIN